MKSIHSCCLTIAGSDSGGNAGVQADLRVFHAYKIHGCSVFAALTAQNPNGVYAIHSLPIDFICSQLDAVLSMYSITALKTGMLSSAEIIEAVSSELKDYHSIIKVIDPVMVATSGARLISKDAINALKKNLLPIASLITPNIPEAEELSGMKINTPDDVREVAKRLYDQFGSNVLIKGGHASDSSNQSEDILYDGVEFFSFVLPRIENPISTHGTGCSLSAALTAELALGADWKNAVEGAKKYVHDAISTSYYVGNDCGVLGF
jgi:hydroxymethylpyrimidine/phosphomethylpyrimidine kinase